MHRFDNVSESCLTRENGSHGGEEREGGGEGGVVEGRERETELSAMTEQLTEEEETTGRGFQ